MMMNCFGFENNGAVKTAGGGKKDAGRFSESKMSKKLDCLCLLIALFSAPLFAESAYNISDYFPTNSGISWDYTLIAAELDQIVSVVDNDTKDGRGIVTMSTVSKSGTIYTRYELKENKVYESVTRDVFGGIQRHNNHCILAQPGLEWRYDESKEFYILYKTSAAKINFDDKTFEDCICVEETINGFLDGAWQKGMSRTYYAKGFGLVSSRFHFTKLYMDRSRERTSTGEGLSCSSRILIGRLTEGLPERARRPGRTWRPEIELPRTAST